MIPSPQTNRNLISIIILANLVSTSAISGCRHASSVPLARLADADSAIEPDPLADMQSSGWVNETAVRIVNRAKLEARRRVSYDASYQRIKYPGGDVPSDRGACTDVVIRSLRSAGLDLQVLVHADMLRNPGHYPGNGHKSDSNIDHRRVPNQKAYLKYHAVSLPVETSGPAHQNWQPGDIIYWKLDNGLDHCGIVSNIVGPSGLPMVIHNLDRAAQEDVLTSWKIVAHYRLPKH